MSYEIAGKDIIFLVESQSREFYSRRILSYAGTALTLDDVQLIVETVHKHIMGRENSSKATYLTMFLKPLLGYFKATGSYFPKDFDGWQYFLLDFFRFYLTDASCTQATANTRIKTWSGLVRNIFVFWTAEGVLPSGLLIPRIEKSPTVEAEANQPLLGENRAEPIAADNKQRLTVNINYSQNDEEYLNTVELDCQKSIEVLTRVCIHHWDALIDDRETGVGLANKITNVRIEQAIMSSCYSEKINNEVGETFFTSSPHPQGHCWAVSLIKKWLNDGDDKECISSKKLAASPFFSKEIFHGVRYSYLAHYTAMPVDAFKKLRLQAQLNRFVGLLSPVDVAVACCLLTIEHPQFNSNAIQSGKVLNARGKLHLVLTDVEGSSIFSVDKPRAGQRKHAVLTPLSQSLIRQIMEITQPIRDIMKRSGDKGWRFLFLGVLRGNRLGVIELISPLLASTRKYSLVNLYPELIQAGLTRGTLDFRRIRTTLGVIRWFETGSVMEMSRKLGNSYKVVIEHYLPPTLLQAWNRRIIRRFQNTLIIIAAYDEDYLLDVTDFSTTADLQGFISQLIFEYPSGSSPLATELNSRINSLPADNIRYEIDSCVLNVRLSPISLAYLYAYSDCVLSNMSEAEIVLVDTFSNLAPIQFVDLARLLKHACENEEISAELSELVDLPKLRRVHLGALAMQEKICQKMKLSLLSKWVDYE
jgi:hypothetical protein